MRVATDHGRHGRVRRSLRSIDSWRDVRRLTATAIGRGEARLTRKRLLPGQRQYRKFAIVTRARTGSNFLVSLLRAHPHVDVHGELFRRMNGEPVATRLGDVFGRKPPRIEAVGFKVFYYHPLDNPHSDLWEQLRDIDDLRVLHLKRRNVLRTLTSRKLAGHTAVWLDRGRGDPRAEKPVVTFSAEELEKAFTQNEAWEAECEERFRAHETAEIYYEDLVTRPEVRNMITGFLGIGAVPMSSSLRRQNPEQLAALITNFDDLRQHFRDTRWASFFCE